MAWPTIQGLLDDRRMWLSSFQWFQLIGGLAFLACEIEALAKLRFAFDDMPNPFLIESAKISYAVTVDRPIAYKAAHLKCSMEKVNFES